MCVGCSGQLLGPWTIAWGAGGLRLGIGAPALNCNSLHSGCIPHTYCVLGFLAWVRACKDGGGRGGVRERSHPYPKVLFPPLDLSGQ